MTIKLVTFDLDGTLWPIEDVLTRANREMTNWIHPRVPEYHNIDDARLNEIRLTVLKTRPEIAHDISAVRIAILETAFQELGLTQSNASELAHGAFEVLIEWRIRVKPFNGVQQVLEQLRTQYMLGTLTNGNANVMATPLKHCFAFNLSAAGVGALKPDPAMFEVALELAGVSPDQAVHVGDHIEDDIGAANEVGMHTIWVDYLNTRTVTSATATVHQFESIPNLLTDLQ